MPKEKQSEMMPSVLTTHSKHLPEMKEWEVGKTYDMAIKGRMSSHHVDSDGLHHATFEINHIDPEYDEEESKGGDEEEKEGMEDESEREQAKKEGKKEEKESGEEDEKTKRLHEKYARRK